MKFELNLRKRNIPKGELVADLQKVAGEIGQSTITAAMYAERGKHGSNTMLRRFGSWNEALSAAGLGLNNRINIPDEELFENLANIWQTLGRQPVGKDVEKASNLSKFALGTYEKRFGSWNKSLEGFIGYINGNAGSESGTQEFSDRESKQPSSRKTSKKINWRLRAAILIRDNCICKMCGASPAKTPEVELHVDHIIPYSKGGETLEENLRTLCSKCNIGRSNQFTE
jgi:hypothetical protein